MTDQSVQHMTREPDTTEKYRDLHGGRHVNRRWVLRENSDGTAELAVLRVSHYAGRPYRATLSRATRSRPIVTGMTSETYALMSDVEVLKQAVSRFNAKTFLAFAEQALAVVQDAANAERFARKFDPNTGLDD